MRQIETSRTMVFDQPRQARAFFAALVADNLDVGRPDHVELIFAGHPRRWGRPPKTEPAYKTRIDTRDTIGVTVNADYKHSRVKQYLKDGRALRIETVINSADDLGCKRRLIHLAELQTKARAVNARLLDTERVGQGCVLASPAFERVAQSTLTEDGRRSPGLRFGDPRVMALLGALCIGLNALGFTNRSLRAQVSQLLGVTYTANQMSYDLARLRHKGLISRRAGTQHLPTHPRRPTRRGLLHQSPRPAPATADRRRHPTRPARTPTSVQDHRPPPDQLHRPRPTRKARMKLKTAVNTSAPKGR